MQTEITGSITASDIAGTGIAIGHGATSIVNIYQHVLRPVPLAYRHAATRDSACSSPCATGGRRV